MSAVVTCCDLAPLTRSNGTALQVGDLLYTHAAPHRIQMVRIKHITPTRCLRVKEWKDDTVSPGPEDDTATTAWLLLRPDGCCAGTPHAQRRFRHMADW